MPDKDGKLSEEEARKAIAWLESKAPDMKCPACGKDDFFVGEHILTLGIFPRAMNASRSYPQLHVYCHNCSHILAFSAVAVGVLPPSKEGEDG